MQVFKPKGVLLFWNWFIIVIYTVSTLSGCALLAATAVSRRLDAQIVGVMGCISSIRVCTPC